MACRTPPVRSEHRFHIPVLGTGFTATTPLEVAPLGVSSVIPLADDTLLEQLRQALSQKLGLDYHAIGPKEDDSRARRTQAFLDLIHDEVERRLAVLRASPFEPGSPIQRYFELLPETPIKATWRHLPCVGDPVEREHAESLLRAAVVPGQIEANIMTKADSRFTPLGVPKPPDQSDALASLRGFAKSKLRSAVVFSAGMNQRLFVYAATLDGFFPDEHGALDKRICLKVSDFRSAQVQGMLLAKKGLWTSEYRIESGLNCGGHAFPTEGRLMGPILDEFRGGRDRLQQQLHETLAAALRAVGRPIPTEPLPVRVSAQGGVGTAAEQQLLIDRYGVDSVGWGSAFLYCPDVVAIDDDTLHRLLVSTSADVELSASSPLGVPFWNLITSKGEQARRSRVDAGRGGSPCPRGILAFDTEFSDYPICKASRRYHAALERSLENVPPEEREPRMREARMKSCLCRDLAGSAQIRWGIDPGATPLICPGPNALYFRRVLSFDDMVGHIYGRNDVLPKDGHRPHMFLNELELCVDYVERELTRTPPAGRRQGWVERYHRGLENGIAHLHELVGQGWIAKADEFLRTLGRLEARWRAVLESAQVAAPAYVPAVAAQSSGCP
ncbi:MAG: hypothetical protein JW940_15285 [Polyangiaceae bacterium]|nr:hypothetical protein [Polyangiaceae bacterium]